jgi:predicted enzyme related to lactoylglutathione lyase
MKAKFVHTNIISNHWEQLASFYEKVFGCIRVFPERDMSGKWIEDGTGMPNAHIKGIHLRLPGHGDSGPTLEIFQYDKNFRAEKTQINQPGFTHIAFLVDDVECALKEVLLEGGGQLGKVVTKDFAELGLLTFVYAKDPENNIIELQSWKK